MDGGDIRPWLLRPVAEVVRSIIMEVVRGAKGDAEAAPPLVEGEIEGSGYEGGLNNRSVVLAVPDTEGLVPVLSSYEVLLGGC